MSALLELRGVSAGYGGQADVVRDVDLDLDVGEMVAVLGANGAGKTTTLRAVSGMIRAAGEVRLGGAVLRGGPDRRARAGLGHVPQGRGTLTHLTVAENLWAGGARLPRRRRQEAFDRWYTLFPKLRERREQAAGSLSGGEQQLLALARALIAEPAVLLLDEPSLGLSPVAVAEVFGELRRVNAEVGTALLLVEQNAAVSLELANRVSVLESGVVVRSGRADEFAADDSLRRAYLGL